MKMRLTFKTPDVVDEAIAEACGRGEKTGSDFERAGSLVIDSRKWFRYGEYVTIEWDTVNNTCRVIPVGE